MPKSLSIFLFLLVPLVMTLSAAGPILRWKQGKDLALSKGGYASGFLDGKLILAGGTHWKDDKKLWLDEVVGYDPQQNRWDSLPPLPKPLAYAASAVHGEKLYFLGGAGPDKPERAGYRLAKQSGKYQWEEFTTLPLDRCYAKSVVLKDQLFLVGGSDSGTDLSTASTSLFSLSLSEPKPAWKTLSPMPEEGRAVFAAAACKGKLYVFGGTFVDASGKIHNLASAYQYDPAHDRWSRLKDSPAPTRAWSASSPDDRYIFLFAGYATPTSSDPSIPPAGRFETKVFRYDTVKNEYEEMAPIPHANCDMAFHFFKGAFYGAGGEPKAKERAPWTFIGQL